MGWLPEWLGGAPPPPKKKICCACPETKGPRDACVTEHGASGGRVARARCGEVGAYCRKRRPSGVLALLRCQSKFFMTCS